MLYKFQHSEKPWPYEWCIDTDTNEVYKLFRGNFAEVKEISESRRFATDKILGHAHGCVRRGLWVQLEPKVEVSKTLPLEEKKMDTVDFKVLLGQRDAQAYGSSLSPIEKAKQDRVEQVKNEKIAALASGLNKVCGHLGLETQREIAKYSHLDKDGYFTVHLPNHHPITGYNVFDPNRKGEAIFYKIQRNGKNFPNIMDAIIAAEIKHEEPKSLQTQTSAFKPRSHKRWLLTGMLTMLIIEGFVHSDKIVNLFRIWDNWLGKIGG